MSNLRSARRDRIIEALLSNPGFSNRRIGRDVGADGKTVASVRESLVRSEILPPQDRTTGLDGKVRPSNRSLAKVPTPGAPGVIPCPDPARSDYSPQAAATDPNPTPGVIGQVWGRAMDELVRGISGSFERLQGIRGIHVRQCRQGWRVSFIVPAKES